MSTTWGLTIYCLLIIVASLAGGAVPLLFNLTHRRLQLAISFVSGVMLGVGLLHLLPHAVMLRLEQVGLDGGHATLEPVLLWLLGGFLVMFLSERFFCYHHHEAPSEAGCASGGCGHDHGDGQPGHRLTWAGAAVGLSVHSVLAGAALAAATLTGGETATVPPMGVATFLMIVLHKPFDSLTLITLMSTSQWSRRMRVLVNLLFGAAVPLGAILFAVGLDLAADPELIGSSALAFSAGMFLCIALSDLLPELQFHSHDRIKLSCALVAGLFVAWGAARLEPPHVHAPAAVEAGHADHGHGNHDHDHDHDHDPG